MSSSRRLVGRSILLAQVAIAIVIAALFVLVASNPSWKRLYDLTPQKRYTVDPSTADLLASVRALREKDSSKKLVVECFFVTIPRPHPQQTENERHAWSIVRRIQELTRDLLRQYSYLGGDAIEVTYHDVDNEIAKSRAAAKQYAMQLPNSLVVAIGNRSKTLQLDRDLADIEVPEPNAAAGPAAQRVARLRDFKGEEAISSAIKSLLVEGKPKIYFDTGHGEPSINSTDALAYRALAGSLQAEDFELSEIKLAGLARVPDDAAIVALLEPRTEPSQQVCDLLYDYLLRGGRVFVNASFMDMPADWNPRLSGLLDRLGLALGKDLVCNGLESPDRPAEFTSGDPKVRLLTVEDLSPSHEATLPLRRVRRTVYLREAREITALASPPAGVHVDTSLLRTRPNSWIHPRDANGEVEDAPRYRGDQRGLAPRCVGASVEIRREGSEAKGRLVLVSGIAFVNRAFEPNGDLGLNLFQWLAERKELIAIRGRKYTSKSLTHVTADQYSRLFRLLVWYVPGALLALAILVLWRRSRA